MPEGAAPWEDATAAVGPGPRVEADPWAVGRGTGLRSTLGTLAAVLLLVAAAAATTTATAVAAAVAATLAALALALATTTRLRGRGRGPAGRRGIGNRSRSGKGGVGGDLVVIGEAEFLQTKHVHRRGEGRQRPRVGDEIGGVGEARVEAVQQGEHQLTVLPGVADVAKSVGVLLQLRGVGFDGEITLSRGSEILDQDDSAWLLVRLEQITNGRVEGAGGLIWRHGKVKNTIRDEVIHPAAHASIRLFPCGISRTERDGAIDVT